MSEQTSFSGIVPRPGYNQNTGLATASLVMGILSFVCCGPVFALPAVILGHIALGQVRRGEAGESSHGLAIAGLVLGYVNLLLVFGVILVYVFIVVIALLAGLIGSIA